MDSSALSDAGDVLRGHLVTASDAPPGVQIAVVLAFNVLLFAPLLGLAWVLVQQAFGLTWSRVVAGAVGLALAILVFPSSARELGVASGEAMQTALRILPPAADVSARCAASKDPDDGCDAHGVVAVPVYLGQAAELVVREWRLAQAKTSVSREAVRAGLRDAARGQVWGLQYAPRSAAAHASTSVGVVDNGLDLASVVLAIVVVVLGATGWTRVQQEVAAFRQALQGEDEPTRRRTRARIKDLTLYAVLGLGAYLAFAAITALGPFLEARRLASTGGLDGAEARIAAVDTEWRAADVRPELPTDGDLDEFERRITQYAVLRRRTLTETREFLASSYNSFEASFDQSFLAVERFDGEPFTELQEIYGLTRDEALAVNNAAEALKRDLTAVFDCAQGVRDLNLLAGKRGGVGADLDASRSLPVGSRYLYFNAFRSHTALLQARLDALQPGPDQRVPEVQRAALAAQVQAVAAAFASFQETATDAINSLQRSEQILSAETDGMLRVLADHRDFRWAVRRESQLLDRGVDTARLTARDELVQAQAEFGAIQRAGPGWMDRLEALSNWYEHAFRQVLEDRQECADALVDALAQEERHLRRALDAFPEGDTNEVPLAILRARLERFSKQLHAPVLDEGRPDEPDAAVVPPVPQCARADAALPPKPERVSAGTRYGTTVGVLSGWLLQMGTLDVVLIAGMLGFGLLGAGLSRIIRRRLGQDPDARTNPEEPLVDDVPSVLFTGLGATLIVYLAGAGGLGAITSVTPTLDPYVLMLGCFVASVFSEDVWRSARGWMKDRKLTE